VLSKHQNQSEKPKGRIHGEEVSKSVRKNRAMKKEELAKAILIQNLN